MSAVRFWLCDACGTEGNLTQADETDPPCCSRCSSEMTSYRFEEKHPAMNDADIIRVAKEKASERCNSFLRHAIVDLKIARADCTEAQELVIDAIVTDLRRLMESECG